MDALARLVSELIDDLLLEVFGEQVGRHARSAVGMAELPMNISVEIEMVVAVDCD